MKVGAPAEAVVGEGRQGSPLPNWVMRSPRDVLTKIALPPGRIIASAGAATCFTRSASSQAISAPAATGSAGGRRRGGCAGRVSRRSSRARSRGQKIVAAVRRPPSQTGTTRFAVRQAGSRLRRGGPARGPTRATGEGAGIHRYRVLWVACHPAAVPRQTGHAGRRLMGGAGCHPGAPGRSPDQRRQQSCANRVPGRVSIGGRARVPRQRSPAAAQVAPRAPPNRRPPGVVAGGRASARARRTSSGASEGEDPRRVRSSCASPAKAAGRAGRWRRPTGRPPRSTTRASSARRGCLRGI